MNGYFHRVSSRTPTDLWVNNVTLKEAELAIEAGCAGCTQNPSFAWRILNGSEDMEMATKLLDEILADEPDDNAAIAKLQAKLVGQICQKFLPMFEARGGKKGWVSIQGDPFHEDCDTIVKYGRMYRAAASNVIVKIPATENGLSAMRILLTEGVPLLATEVMSMDQAIQVCDLYDELTNGMENPPEMHMAQIAGIFDDHLKDVAKQYNKEIAPELFYIAGTAIAKKVHKMMIDRRSKVHFMSGGARTLSHFTEMVGLHGSVTINWNGYAKELIDQNTPVIERFYNPVDFAIIDELSENFEAFKKAYTPGSLTEKEYDYFGPVVKFRSAFEKGWGNCLKFIAERRKKTVNC